MSISKKNQAVRKIKKISFCRACKKRDIEKIISLGPTPNANSYLHKNRIDSEEYYYPLDVYFCNSCYFLQLGHEIMPEILFEDYVYVSGTSPVFIKHFEKYADEITHKLALNKNSLVIDIGSNDGTLLSFFKKNGMKVLGVEPVKKIALTAQKKGIKSVIKFFNISTAKFIKLKYGRADVICANNTFAQISDLDSLLKGVDELLSAEGVFVIEVPYVVDMLQKGYFDLIYHEHHSFPAVYPLSVLLGRYKMEIFDVEKIPVHGGTIRVFVKRKSSNRKIEKSVDKFINREIKLKLNQKVTYINFFINVHKNKLKLLILLNRLKEKNKIIAGYGAPAKANTLLNLCNIGPDMLDFIIDDSSWKQDLFTPGKRIPIVSSDKLYKNPPDYLLILAWNFADSIMEMHKEYKKRGGKFIIPFPKPKII